MKSLIFFYNKYINQFINKCKTIFFDHWGSWSTLMRSLQVQFAQQEVYWARRALLLNPEMAANPDFKHSNQTECIHLHLFIRIYRFTFVEYIWLNLTQFDHMPD